MAAPVVYTEATLLTFMLDTMGSVATTLGMSDYMLQEAVNDTLLAYRVADSADATDIPRLRALARVAAWRTALAQASTYYDFSADGATYNRAEITRHIRAMLALAEADAAAYDGGMGGVWVNVLGMRLTDPYRVIETDAAGVD